MLKKVRVHLQDPMGLTTLCVKALEVSSTCNQVIPVPDQKIINALKSHSIDTTALLYGSGMDKGISILIGSDFYWEIVTGNIKGTTASASARILFSQNSRVPNQRTVWQERLATLEYTYTFHDAPLTGFPFVEAARDPFLASFWPSNPIYSPNRVVCSRCGLRKPNSLGIPQKG